jgi:hypothetical protein
MGIVVEKDHFLCDQDRCFIQIVSFMYCSSDLFIIRAMMMEAARTSETLVNFYQTTQRYNPDDSHLQLNPVHTLFP